MRKKHFSGYGSVDISVKSREMNTVTGISSVTIEVAGNHECGLVVNDKYNVINWLGKIGKFNSENILEYTTQEFSKRNEEKHIDEEHCIYIVKFKNSFYE